MEERFVTLDEFLCGDVIFLTGTTVEVLPVICVDGKPIGSVKPISVTLKLQAAFQRFKVSVKSGSPQDMKLHKKEIAKRQIETALDLFFLQGDISSIITLAGAGEEILGNLLRRTGKPCMMDHLIDYDKCLTVTGRAPKIVHEEVNGIRNSMKHANNPLEDELEVDSEHAVAMLTRAVTNYVSLEGSLTPPMRKFYEHLQLLHPDVCR